ncbi:MAG TPA: class II aldolase/adducin family protein [Bryobacteraceae bacterium]|nr:class II aldolase/adducin family protein [Bryobacteraceae bacterium]
MSVAAEEIRTGRFSPKDGIGTQRSDTSSLLRFSATIGRDPLLVQASSGNTSFKLDGTLWIKASGKWLAKADQEDILVPVSLSECLECLKGGRPLPACDRSLSPAGLLPSIETLMHAVLPQRFVVHVHSIDTLAWAVRSDATAQLTKRLSGLHWKWIPYVPSGLPLAREIQIVSSTQPCPDVFILGNHGLVVCGENCEAAELLLARVQRCLAVQPRRVTGRFHRLEAHRGSSSWRLPDFEALHALGTDAISRRIVKGGVLYPCQVMFLGPRLALLEAANNLSDVGTRIDQLDTSCPFAIVEGFGVLINNKITAAQHAVLNGFAEVVRRIDVSAPIRYLTDYEVNTIMTADGHRYRISAEDSGPS